MLASIFEQGKIPTTKTISFYSHLPITGVYTAPRPPPNAKRLPPKPGSTTPPTNPKNFVMFQRCIK